MELIGILVRNLIFYTLNELCDFELIDEDPGLIKEKRHEEPLSRSQYIEKYC